MFRRLGRNGSNDRLEKFLLNEMGIQQRYFCPPDRNALDLARDALSRLVSERPGIVDEAEFLILCGISNPMPVTTMSALLAGEFGFRNVSCWDLKSGCSTGVLALIQAHGWMQAGAKGGVIVCAETLSKFSNPALLQMTAAVGDGAVALHVERSDQWIMKSMVHGTDPSLARGMMVKGTFPIDPAHYSREDYYFSFNHKPEGIEAIGRYWVSSLQELLVGARIEATEIQHYIAHQVDSTKNAAVAATCGILPTAVAKNFSHFGNMGCPTLFINYLQWFKQHPQGVRPGQHLVLHAVGGGVSWAGLCLERRL